MESKPFKFRRVHEIAGAFVFVLLALFLTLVVVSGRLQGWFEPKRIFEVMLPREGIRGLRPGSEVHILGERVGRVRSIELRVGDERLGARGFGEVNPDAIQLVAVLQVRGDRVVFIGEESVAMLKADLGGFGAAYLDITRGSTPIDEERRSLPLQRELEGTGDLNDMAGEVRDALIPAIEQVRETSREIAVLAQSLSAPSGNLQQSIAGLTALLEQINGGEGTLTMLLDDADLSRQVRQTSLELSEAVEVMAKLLERLDAGEGAVGVLVSDLEAAEDMRAFLSASEEASRRANEVLGDFGRATDGLPSAVDSSNAALAEIGEAAVGLQEAIEDYERVAEAFQRHWLIRRFVEEDEAEEMAGSEKARERGGLFRGRGGGERTKGAEDPEELRQRGASRGLGLKR